jgi:hypothetical protein
MGMPVGARMYRAEDKRPAIPPREGWNSRAEAEREAFAWRLYLTEGGMKR